MKKTDLLEQVAAKLAKARVSLDIDDYDRKMLAKYAAHGAIFVSNQLLAGLDEWVLIALLAPAYKKVKILHPYPTPPPQALRDIAIRPQRRELADRFLRLNFAKKTAKYVQKGRAVALSLNFSDNLLSNYGKNMLRAQILKQLQKAGQTIIPIHLQTEHLPGGFLRKSIQGLAYPFTSAPVRISVRIGTPITAENLQHFSQTRLWGKYLQAKIFSLGSLVEFQPEHFTAKKESGNAPVADPVPAEIILAEITALKPEYRVADRGQFDVFIAPFSALPNVVFEIARLREITFRAVGEGTGQPRDLDEYDLYYLQLIIWDREKQQIVGGYRLGLGDQIFKKFGVNGFYTSSLFKMKSGFFPILQEAVELGRTYVIPEYQRHRLPLFLLWKGILTFLVAHPRYRYLYGPVSISQTYSEASKGVIVEFVRRFFFDKSLAKFVVPRKPFRVKLKSVNTKILAESLHGEFEALESLVETMEPTHFKVPVLFRQYLKQNAKFIAFNVDPLFSDCLDGLMILDIRYLPESTVEVLQQEK